MADDVSKNREAVYLRRNTRLIRHAAIRRILYGRYHSNGIRNLDQLVSELQEVAGIRVTKETVSTDLREMGAIKVRDVERPTIEWWVLPAFNPNVENLRDEMDADLIEAEVGFKLAAHVVDMTPVGRYIYVLTEARAGTLVAYWLSWLTWPGILLVQEQLDGCIIHCVNDHAALEVAEKLIGAAPKANEEGDGDDGE